VARPCPACGRPNADTAAKCLYCVAPLPTPEAAPAAPEAAPADRFLLILLPSGTRDDETIASFSRIASLSVYDARLSLSSGRPRLFRRLEGEEEARRFSEELFRARIPHYTVAESSVMALPVARAQNIDLQERHLEVTVDGSRMTTRYDDLFLLIRGEITRERHDEKKVGSPKGASRRLTPGMRLHLYPREAACAVEVDPDLFDFQLLGLEKTGSSILNLEKLIGRLTERASHLVLDRGFDLEPVLLSRGGVRGDIADALAASEGSRSGVPYDNEASFRFYSRWRYRVAWHLERRESA
jgi:hypothetical protein